MVNEVLLNIENAKPSFEDSTLPPVVYDLKLRESECIVIETNGFNSSSAFADLCSGMVPLEQGQITFENMNWFTLPEPRLSALRGRIGRVYQQNGWIDMYSVAINILMPMLHHTSVPIEKLTADALRLCRILGLPGLPMDIPRHMRSIDLQRAACVRALLGKPNMLLLEHPFEGFSATLLFPLFELLNMAQNRGAGIIIFTRNFSLWETYKEKVTHWMRLYEKGLTLVRL